MKVSNKWRKMAEIYKRFSLMDRDYPDVEVPQSIRKIWQLYDEDRDASEEAMFEAYSKETFGTPCGLVRANGKINAYVEGKQCMDLTLTEYWLPDIANNENLTALDLYRDFPRWFVNKVLPIRYHLSDEEYNKL
jgi:hypothetical protein